METITCTIQHIVFQNSDNGYSVFNVTIGDDIGYQTIVGSFQGVGVGTTVVAKGDWKTNSRFGRQFVVESWHEELPATAKGIEAYLASGLIKGIGQKYAKRIVKMFGVDTFTILDFAPERLLEVEGIGKGRMEKIRKSWEENKAISNVMVFLQGHGISPAYAIKIYKEYGDDSIQKVKDNPYALADDIFGIGFKKADEIAFSFGYEKTDLSRCKAGVIYTLGQMADEGHCYAGKDKLYGVAMELLDVEYEYIDEAINHLAFEQKIIIEGDMYFLPMYYYSEQGVAGRIKLLLDNPDKNIPEVDIDEISKATGIEYDDVQKDAIRIAVRSKFMVLTGLPGTGKTTTVLGIIRALESVGKNILCAAPTGRAAKRMSEATGKEAKTIHRLLEYTPKDGFKRNDKFPLQGDVLIVDESSMIDIVLMNSLMKAVPKKMRVILVGDIDQLPSVGAGNVLRDIIDSEVVPVVRLTKIFRQAQTSRIITNSHKVNKGEMPDISNGKDTDFFFIKQEDSNLAAQSILDIVKSRIPKAYGYSIDDIQVLTPMKNGAVGTNNLNIILQEAINPVGEFIQSGMYKYRVGDKVMQIKNNYDKNVFNGDVGKVVDICSEDRMMAVLFDKEPVIYESGDLNEITLAYACTIHKSQGSEYPVVVIPLTMSHYIMLQRNLVYTGITRAKKICILIGDTKALAMAVKNMVVTLRNTMLKERLKA